MDIGEVLVVKFIICINSKGSRGFEGDTKAGLGRINSEDAAFNDLADAEDCRWVSNETLTIVLRRSEEKT